MISYLNHTVHSSSTTHNTASFSHNSGSGGDNRILVVATMAYRGGTPMGINTCTYGGISLKRHTGELFNFSGAAVLHLELWYLLNPPTGSNTLTVIWNNTHPSRAVIGISYSGVKGIGSGAKLTGQAASGNVSLDRIDDSSLMLSAAVFRGGDTDPLTAAVGTLRGEGATGTAVDNDIGYILAESGGGLGVRNTLTAQVTDYFITAGIELLAYGSPQPLPAGETVVTVGNQAGRVLAVITPLINPVSSRINGIGTCDLVIPASQISEALIRPGNRVLIEFGNGLEPWGGIMEYPFTWVRGAVSVPCFTPDKIFRERITGVAKLFKDYSAGNIIAELIRDANDQSDTGIQLGSIYTGGLTFTVEYNLAILEDIFTDLITAKAGGEYRIRSQNNGGVIEFFFDYLEAIGYPKLYLAFDESKNVADDYTLIEQGQLTNYYHIAGAGDSWDANRLTTIAQDNTAIALNGLRQAPGIFGDLDNLPALEVTAAQLLAVSKDPILIYGLRVFNQDPAPFSYWGLGDTLGLRLPGLRYGVDSNVRVMAWEYDPGSGVLEVVVKDNG